MNKKIVLSLALALSLMLTACGSDNGNKAENNLDSNDSSKVEENKDNAESKDTDSANNEEVKVNEDGTREIAGFDGKTIVLPPVEEFKSIIIMHPTLMSYAIQYAPDKNTITGAHVAGLEAFNKDILGLLFPEWKNVNTSFTAEGSFGANIEELMKLNPDLIFYDEQYQGEGLDKIDTSKIPVNVYSYNEDTEKVSIEMDRVCRAIFDVDGAAIMETEWKKADDKAKELIDFSKDKKKVLFVWQDTGEQLTVAGKGTAIVKTCEKLNLENVASEIEAAKPVSMEQIYQWNPDYIFLLAPNAKEILAGEDKQKDWSKLTAFEEKHIYSVPTTQVSWVFPSVDSPLCIYYLINKCYPEKLSDKEMDKLFFDYYKEVHNVELKEDLINKILNR